MSQKTALVTGSSGFIGFHMARTLLERGHKVIGIDALTDYYDPRLKQRRQGILETHATFQSYNFDLQDFDRLNSVMQETRPDFLVHLAAQAGVRYSIDAPRSYVESNLIGGFNILEAARQNALGHLLFASTSSVFGGNETLPYAEHHKADLPMSFYAATKKSNEAMAHSYAHLYNIPTTMFRFFTVYGPWGRPDMALFKFTRAILDEKPIDVYNNGNMSRDFTYVDDIIDAIMALLPLPPKTGEDGASPVAPYRIVNIGNANPVKLMDFIEILEKILGKSAIKNMMPMQAGDVYNTWADTSLLYRLTGVEAKTDLETGVRQFVEWYTQSYNRES